LEGKKTFGGCGAKKNGKNPLKTMYIYIRYS